MLRIAHNTAIKVTNAKHGTI